MNSQRSQRHYSSTTSEQKLDFMIINGNINKNKITAYCTSRISSLTHPWKFLYLYLGPNLAWPSRRQMLA